MDDCIIVGKSMESIDSFVESLIEGPENFILTDEGNIDKFLGIEITQLDYIDHIIKFLGFDIEQDTAIVNSKSTLVGKPILNKDISLN